MRVLQDRDVEVVISQLLRAMVVVVTVVVVIGAVILFTGHPSLSDYHSFHSEPHILRSVGGILSAAAAGQGEGVIQLGLLVLILTPILRVALSVVAFAMEHDRLYVGFTLIVLGLLCYSLLLG